MRREQITEHIPITLTPTKYPKTYLVERTALATLHDSTSVAHSAAWWRGNACDKAYHRLVWVTVLLEPFCCVFFCGSANLTNHNNTLGLGVVREALEAVDEVCAIEGVATDADAGGLTKARNGS